MQRESTDSTVIAACTRQHSIQHMSTYAHEARVLVAGIQNPVSGSWSRIKHLQRAR